MSVKADRDIGKGYPTADFVAKLRRLGMCRAEKPLPKLPGSIS